MLRLETATLINYQNSKAQQVKVCCGVNSLIFLPN
jgi:hypothetical protein